MRSACRFFPLLLTAFGLLANPVASQTTVSATPGFVGSSSCANCHAAEHADWQQSHHHAAMQPANEQTVLGDFNNARFVYNGITSQFYRREGRYYVSTDNAQGKLQEFQVTYTFGIEPLQQYLIDFPDGRKQVLSIAWDSRAQAEGGQRWYHLFPEDQSLRHGEQALPAVDYRDPLHWTGPYFNWNSRCASCHSTDFRKNYNAETNRYQSQWFEVNLGCESCHGAASNHLAWAAAMQKDKTSTAIASSNQVVGTPDTPDASSPSDTSTATHLTNATDVSTAPNADGDNKGFGRSLANRGIWAEKVGPDQKPRPTLRRSGPSADPQMQVCAGCHSRRTELSTQAAQQPYSDDYLLRLLEDPLYYADGQMHDEVYVWGSFLQSKMHQEGVACSNCHNPHSLKVKAEGNALCGQCHNAQIFDSPKHHHHANNAGSQCVNCHMPTTTYMGVDDRRDHSFRIPRPALAQQIGAPNACNQCHHDKDADWSQAAIDQWMNEAGKMSTAHPFAAAFHAADQGKAMAPPQLLAIANNRDLPGIIRGSAMQRYGNFFAEPGLAIASRMLDDTDPLVRRGTVTALEALPLEWRYNLLSPHLNESSLSVRVEMARILAPVPLSALPEAEAAPLQKLFSDYLAAQAVSADMPEAQAAIGHFYQDQQNFSAAEEAYRRALQLSPKQEVALLNLADLYRQLGRDAEAEPLLRQAVENSPQSANAHYALGLLLIRQNQLAAAVDQLQEASRLHGQNAVYAYTYALALQKQGRSQVGADYLRGWLRLNGPEATVEKVLHSLEATL